MFFRDLQLWIKYFPEIPPRPYLIPAACLPLRALDRIRFLPTDDIGADVSQRGKDLSPVRA